MDVEVFGYRRGANKKKADFDKTYQQERNQEKNEKIQGRTTL